MAHLRKSSTVQALTFWHCSKNTSVDRRTLPWKHLHIASARCCFLQQQSSWKCGNCVSLLPLGCCWRLISLSTTNQSSAGSDTPTSCCHGNAQAVYATPGHPGGELFSIIAGILVSSRRLCLDERSGRSNSKRSAAFYSQLHNPECQAHRQLSIFFFFPSSPEHKRHLSPSATKLLCPSSPRYPPTRPSCVKREFN